MEGEGGNYLVVGGTSIDLMEGRRQLGGSAYYASMALIHLGIKPIIVTNSSTLKSVFGSSAEVISPTKGSEVIYGIREFPKYRELKLIRCAAVRLISLLENHPLINSKHKINGLIISPIACELRINDLNKLISRFSDVGMIGIDIQGFMRDLREGSVVRINYENFYRLIDSLRGFRGTYFIKGDVKEYPPPCRGGGIADCVDDDFKGLIIQTNAGDSLHIYPQRNKELISLKPLPNIYGEETGTGDIFTAVLTYLLSRGEKLISAISKASVAGGLKVARYLPPWFTYQELELLERKVAMTYRRVLLDG